MRLAVVPAAALAASLLLASTAMAGPLQTLTFGGTLGYGWNGSAGLAGQAYSVTLAYDPSLFTQSYSVDSCGPNPGLSCYFTFGGANTVTETLTVGGTTQTFVATGGGFTLSGGAAQTVTFGLTGANNLSIYATFTGTALLPNAWDANNPVLSSFSNQAVTLGSFSQNYGGTNLGGTPTRLSAAPLTLAVASPAVASTATATVTAVAVPEPGSMLMLGAGVLGAGLLRWRRERAA